MTSLSGEINVFGRSCALIPASAPASVAEVSCKQIRPNLMQASPAAEVISGPFFGLANSVEGSHPDRSGLLIAQTQSRKANISSGSLAYRQWRSA